MLLMTQCAFDGQSVVPCPGGESLVSNEFLEYADYHRTVIGYHGTSEEAADRLVSGDAFRASDRDDEWFGQGIYFWEHAFKHAWRWAKLHKKHARPAVIGAVIRLGNCFDLLDPGNALILRDFHGIMIEDLKAKGLRIPVNQRHRRFLDCAVFNFMYDELETSERPLDTARAVYVPSSTPKRVWKGSWISEETHIQICVRNPKSILAVWHVQRDGHYGKPPAARLDADG